MHDGIDTVPTDRSEQVPMTNSIRGDRVLVLNPESGSGDHAPAIRVRAAERGIDVRETGTGGDARRLAREAVAQGVSLVAVAGGDGTVNEVVRGIHDAGAFEVTTVGIIPTGTANFVAQNLGIDDIDHAFEVLDRGEQMDIDVALADGRPFMNTCLAGLSAEANAATPGRLKRRLGVIAYLVTTIRLFPEYEGSSIRLTIEPAEPGTDPTLERWSGRALLVLVGNAFRLPGGGSRERPSVADGLLEVTVVAEPLSVDALELDAISDLLDHGVTPIERLEASSLSITSLEGKDVSVTLDGEPWSTAQIEITVEKRALSVLAGSTDRTT